MDSADSAGSKILVKENPTSKTQKMRLQARKKLDSKLKVI